MGERRGEGGDEDPERTINLATSHFLPLCSPFFPSNDDGNGDQNGETGGWAIRRADGPSSHSGPRSLGRAGGGEEGGKGTPKQSRRPIDAVLAGLTLQIPRLIHSGSLLAQHFPICPRDLLQKFAGDSKDKFSAATLTGHYQTN